MQELIVYRLKAFRIRMLLLLIGSVPWAITIIFLSATTQKYDKLFLCTLLFPMLYSLLFFRFYPYFNRLYVVIRVYFFFMFISFCLFWLTILLIVMLNFLAQSFGSHDNLLVFSLTVVFAVLLVLFLLYQAYQLYKNPRKPALILTEDSLWIDGYGFIDWADVGLLATIDWEPPRLYRTPFKEKVPPLLGISFKKDAYPKGFKQRLQLFLLKCNLISFHVPAFDIVLPEFETPHINVALFAQHYIPDSVELSKKIGGYGY